MLVSIGNKFYKNEPGPVYRGCRGSPRESLHAKLALPLVTRTYTHTRRPNIFTACVHPYSHVHPRKHTHTTSGEERASDVNLAPFSYPFVAFLLSRKRGAERYLHFFEEFGAFRRIT